MEKYHSLCDSLDSEQMTEPFLILKANSQEVMPFAYPQFEKSRIV